MTNTAPPPPAAPAWRARLARWVDSPRVQWTINILILLNAVTLGLETSPYMIATIGPVLWAAEMTFLTVFCLEILLKLLAYGHRFFRDPWNLFDVAVVGIALVPAAGPLTVLRALRVLRVLRFLKTLPRLRMIVEGTLRVLPDLGWVFVLLSLVYYVFAVIGTKLFAAEFPELFGSLGKSLFTLFQVMTLESWSTGVARIVMERYPASWIYFVSFILVASFIVLNMVIGVVVNGFQGVMQGAQSPPGVPPTPDERKPPLDVEAEILSIQKKLDLLLRQHPRREPNGNSSSDANGGILETLTKEAK